MNTATRKTILLVEDEALIAMTEKMGLEKYGYSVRTVTTGVQAVEAIQTSSDIDLVLMDINLGPGIDGTEAAEIILKDRDIPIVFLSSHTDPEVVEKTEKITSYGYVVKNSNIAVLDASIKMAFKLFKAKTEEKQAKQTIDFQRITYEEILEQSLAGYWDWDIPTGDEYLSPTFKKMFGYEEHEIENRAESWQKLIFQEDFPGVCTPAQNGQLFRWKADSDSGVIRTPIPTESGRIFRSSGIASA